jgi:hypothetical protein
MAKAASALADKVEDEAMQGQLVLGEMLMERAQEIMPRATTAASAATSAVTMAAADAAFTAFNSLRLAQLNRLYGSKQATEEQRTALTGYIFEFWFDRAKRQQIVENDAASAAMSYHMAVKAAGVGRLMAKVG